MMFDSPTPSTGPASPGDSARCDVSLLQQIIETQNDIVSVELDHSFLMQMIAERTRKITNADGAVVELLEDAQLVYRAAAASPSSLLGTRLSAHNSLSGHCGTTGQLVYCRDIETDPHVNRETARRLGIRSMIVVPLIAGSKTIGVLKVVSARVSAFSEQHLLALRLMAGLLGAALNHSSEFKAKAELLAERTSALAQLRTSEEEYRALFEHAGVAKSEFDLATGRFLRVNRKFTELTGYSADEALRLTFHQITHPDDRAADLHRMQRTLRNETPGHSFEKRYIRKDGQTIWASVTTATIHDPAGIPTRGVSSIQDITLKKQSEWLESDRRKTLEMAIAGAPLPDILGQFTLAVERQVPNAIAAFILVADGTVSLIGPNLPPALRHQLSQRTIARAVDLSAASWDSPDHCGRFLLQSDPLWADCAEIARDHHLASAWSFPIASGGSGPYGLLLVFSELSRPPSSYELDSLDTANKILTICIEHHNATHQLTRRSSHDPLTGLPNRALFEDRLHQALANAARRHTSVGYLLLDIDKFKSINDSFGHQVGDRVLQLFAHRAGECLREMDTIARLGGDEFVILLPDLHDPAESATVAQRLVHAFAQPLLIPDVGPLHATVSIGIATAPLHGRESQTLQKHADLALYRVKNNGRNGFSL